MRLDEFQLAGQVPSNVQRAVPATAQPTAQPAMSTTGTGATEQDAKNALISLVDSSKDLPPDSPVHEFVNKFLNTILTHIQDIPVQEASKMLQNVQDANSELLQTVLLNLSQLTSEELTIVTSETTDINAKVEAVKKIADRLLKTKPVQKAFKKQVATIELDVKGNIGELDSAIERRAQKFAKDFGLPLKWARNLIGMFDVSITRKQRDEFLAACEAGTALDVNKMIQDGEGRVEDYVLLKQPKIKDVYNSVKDTLLDISLSTGQRGATGPFEAMMAIMGGCKKPATNEGGDLKTSDGLKLEVKATSISPSTESPTSGGNTNAWLDSTAGKEISGSALRKVANKWLRDLAPESLTDKKFQTVWDKADFRSGGLVSLKEAILMLRELSYKPAPGKKLITGMMAEMYPNITNLKSEGYDFDAACMRILSAIGKSTGDIKADKPTKDIIAKEQGVMGLLEYIKGKGNDGFVFFNSSTQKFKIVIGVKGVIAELGAKDSNLHFDSPMTMGGSAKASAGVYYGAKPGSPEGQEYLQKFNSSPERVEMYRQAQLAKQAAAQNKSLAMIEAAKEGLTEFEFDGKKYSVSKAALKKYFEPDIPMSRTKKKTR
jgi:hypothetical protein